MKEMELKLVAEIKERADQKQKNSRESPQEPLLAVSGISHDPVVQLVTELSQTLHLGEREMNSERKDEKCLIRKNSQSNIITTNTNKQQQPPENNGVNFVTQLKKIDATKKCTTKEKTESNDSAVIIDFKSRLRKVDGGNEKKIDENKIDDNELETNKRQSTASSDSGNAKLDESDDKRKSTGSISSLKKLWEQKDATDNCGNIQLSPKLSLKNNRNEEIIEVSPNDTSDESIKFEKLNKNDKKVWPPSIVDDKPSIPTKPPVKAAKPVVINRPTAGSAIYATPIAPNNPKPPISAKPANLENKTPEDDTKLNVNSDKNGKENILEISQALESTLNSIKTNPTVPTATWLQLSDKIGLLHGSCMDYADNVVPAHTKFQFRELLTRLETQGRQLRSAGSRNTTENTRYINEVNNTIKDVVNVVFR